MSLRPSFPVADTWIAAVVAMLALTGVGCMAPVEQVEEERGSTESSVVSAAGGACPVNARMSQAFKKGHDGVDLANAIGTPIFAVGSGVVVSSGKASGYGQWIQIKHDDGSMTEYGHMSRRDVQVGARVKAGQRIALVGSEGKSTGPHLHLRTYRSAAKTGSGNGMNPVEYLKARGVSLPCTPSGIVDDDAAEAAPDAGDDADEAEANGTVKVWKTATLRASAAADAEAVETATAKKSYDAICWTTGETVTSNGYSHDKWVKIEVDGTEGFISGIFLTGDETGGVSTKCE